MKATVFDTETTGLIINPARKLDAQPEIISIAIQSFESDTGEMQDLYYRVFKPTRPISEEITKITGFTNDYVKDFQSIELELPFLIPILRSSNLLIGQNLRFDMDMIELECRRYNTPPPRWPPTIDLVANTIHLKGYRLSLKNLHIELFGTAFEDSHRAGVDVAATVRCAVELFKRGLL